MTTFPLALSALAIDLPGVDWLYEFTNNLTDLTTANGGALTSLGLTLLSFVAMMQLVKMVVSFSTANMTLSMNSAPLDVGEVVRFMLRLGFCCILESYWVNPLPGVSFGFNHLFSYAAQAIVTVLDHNSLETFTALIGDAWDKTGSPSLTAPIEFICYFLVVILLGLASAVLFVINISSFVFYAVAALFGPVFIPLYMTETFRGKFLSFVEVLLSFAMIRAVASAFIFVWAGFMTTFLQKTFNGDYSIAMWLANLLPVIMVFVAFIANMLFIPAITQAIFGGGAGVTASAQNLITRVALRSYGGRGGKSSERSSS